MLAKKKYILAVAESTYGTDPTPDGANAILTSNCQVQPHQGNRVSRNLDRPGLGNDPEIATGRFTTVTFDVEVAGSGTAGTAPGWGVLLLGCGFDETVVADTSVTYAPVSESFDSLTIYYYLDGELHKLTGARGTVSFNLSRDQIPMMSFSFTGLANDPTAPTVIAPDNSLFVQPLPVTEANTPTYTVDSFAVRAETFTLDMACAVVYRNVVNSESVILTDRAPAGTLVFEQEAIGTKNFWALSKSGALVEIDIVHGTTAGNIVQITGSQVQLSQPSLGDSDGLSTMSMNTLWTPTDSGDDEVAIVVT
ncbi:phage tail tube protein [uncultured Zhongshania sp.]|uniref:phage tail tube protein n=1 Tax=uncultured Zhongshania sp. TaxID=1642288 RepID=UPI0030D75304